MISQEIKMVDSQGLTCKEEFLAQHGIEIIGNGDIASALREAAGYVGSLAGNRLYLASGVSNPNPLPEPEYQREAELLRRPAQDKELRGLQAVYFSTLRIDAQTRYAQHKREMESLIMNLFPRYVIARLGIITWGHNPHTTIGFLRERVVRGEPFNIRETTRDIVTMEDFIRQVNLLPKHNCVAEIHGKIMTEREIFRKYVSADYSLP